jgi:hypothetical protein
MSAHRHPRHALDAAGDDEVLGAGLDRLRGEVHGLLPGAAKAVQRHARDINRPSSGEQRSTRDVRALFAGLGDTTDDDVVDLGGIDIIAFDNLVQRHAEHVDRMDLRQRSRGRARAASASVDDGFTHGCSFRAGRFGSS